MRRFFFMFLICFAQFALLADESWQEVLRHMALGTNVAQLNRTNCISIMLPALQSNNVVKALIFMPGATDEFYMYRRAKAKLTNSSPTLLDAVTALTNQTEIKATFSPPFLLLHTDEDPLQPIIVIKNKKTAEELEHRHFAEHVVLNDCDWDNLLPYLDQRLKIEFLPKLYSLESFHFYRHSFAAWNLTGWEVCKAAAFAGKTKFTVNRNSVLFEVDSRYLTAPKLDHSPFFGNE